MTVAGEISKRTKFRHTHRLRRFEGFDKWGTIAVPTAPMIEIDAAGGGLVKILLKTGYGFNKITSAVVEWSLDGTTAWTATTLTAYTVGNKLLTTGVIAVGAKYFRVRLVNAFGAGPNSNTPLITVT